MQMQHIGHRIRGFYRVARVGQGTDMNPQAQHRITVLRFWQAHGTAAGRPAPPALVAEVRCLRKPYPNLGKLPLSVWVGRWGPHHGIAPPSVSTLGNMMAAEPDKMRHAPLRLDARGMLWTYTTPCRCSSCRGAKRMGLYPQCIQHWPHHCRGTGQDAHWA